VNIPDAINKRVVINGLFGARNTLDIIPELFNILILFVMSKFQKEI